MMKFVFAVFLLLAISVFAQDADTSFTVTYVSGQLIYIDAGRSNGIEVGDSLVVIHDGKKAGTLLVQFAAEKTAATRQVKPDFQVEAGDHVSLLAKHRALPVTAIRTDRRRSQPQQKPMLTKKKKTVLVYGHFALQWRYSHYGSRNVNQPGINLNLRARHLFNGNYELAIRHNSRFSRRSYTFADRIPAEEWRHRLYSFSFAYTAKDALINYRLGRIFSNAINGVGYLDGVNFESREVSGWRLGAFGGAQPHIQDFALPTDVRKYGGYVKYKNEQAGRHRFESTMALTGEYQGSLVSREFLFMSNSYVRKRFSIFQSGEIDVNRDWRKERAQESISFSNIYFHINGRITKRLSAGLSYDNRKNYYSLQWRTMADSLFDHAMRYGMRGHVRYAFPNQLDVYLNGGARLRQGAALGSYNVALGARKSNLSHLNLFAEVNASGLYNPFLRGGYFSMRIGKYFDHGHSLDFSYGGFYYNMPGAQGVRTTQWLRGSAYFNFARHLYCRPFVEIDFGDDAPGQQIFVEAGYRL